MGKYKHAAAAYEATYDLDPERAWAIFSYANNGRTHEQSMMAREILEKDADIAQGWSVRSAALLGLEWELVGGLPEHRAAIYRVLRNARPEMGSGLVDFRGLLSQLELSAMHGFTCAQIAWAPGGASIEGFECPPHAWFSVDTEKQVPYLQSEGADAKIYPTNGRWIFHRYGSAGSEIQRAGLVRPLGFLYSFKRLVLGSYLRYLEKFGMPVISANLPQRLDDVDNGERQRVARMLDLWSSDGSFIVPEDVKLTFLQPAQQSGNQYQDALTFMQSQCWRLLLGQDATSSAAASTNMTQAGLVRRDILIHDAQSIAETITSQVCIPLIANTFGAAQIAKGYPRFKFKTDTAGDIQSAAASLQMIGQAAASLGLELESENGVELGGFRFKKAVKQEATL